MTLTVDNPILNSPYREPERYWLYDAAGMLRVEYVIAGWVVEAVLARHSS
jgi:hypothetical protein